MQNDFHKRSLGQQIHNGGALRVNNGGKTTNTAIERADGISMPKS